MAAWAGWSACALAELLIALYDVESVLVTGPMILIVGGITITLALWACYRALALLGLANVGVCLLFFGLVLLFDWSPSEAKGPFTWMGVLYTGGTLLIVRHLTRQAPRQFSPWECARCGYLLYGLTEPRCPECATPFDPALLNTPRAAWTCDGERA